MESSRWQRAAFAVAGLLALAAAAGIVDPSVYARETWAFARQGIAQDWLDLVVVAPVLLVAGWRASTGSTRARFVIAGALAYVAYSYVVYAVGVHFNRLFLLYCALVGLPSFALASLLPSLPRARVSRPIAAALFAIAATFALLWLAQIFAALWRGTTPPAIVDAGLASSPVYVLDLALVLPAMLATAVRAWRGDARFAAIAWVLLGFAALMLAAIASIIAMQLRG